MNHLANIYSQSVLLQQIYLNYSFYRITSAIILVAQLFATAAKKKIRFRRYIHFMTHESYTLCFVGDISLNDSYESLLETEEPVFPFKKIRNAFEDSDLVVGNLESPFATKDCIPKFPMKTPLRAHPSYIYGLKWAGFDVLNLSNNHILDYGKQAVIDTQRILDSQGIRHFGYGRNLHGAKSMEIITKGSLKIGFVGYTDLIIDSPFYADSNTRGIVDFNSLDFISETIKNKALVDILIISLHWGIEYFHLPSPRQIANARKLIDAGADIIIGHHPHVLQGIERYKHGIIAYSLGNFVFSEILWEWHTSIGEKRLTKYPLTKRTREGCILKVNIENATISPYFVIGTSLKKNGQVIFDSRVNQRINILSEKLKHDNYDRYFSRELNWFNKKYVFKTIFKRLLRFYKLRPKHFKELHDLLTHDK